jgi:hypothetical protein
LGLQPRGGDIVIHGADALGKKFFFTGTGRLGLGTLTPVEKLDIDGAIRIGTTVSNNEGTIRYTGTGFEGRTATEWVPLEPLWRTVSANEIHHNAVNAKVGIGTDAPTATLHVSRPSEDPLTSVDLAENTGIIVCGPLEENIAFDSHQIQARTGAYVGGGSTLSITPSTLNLQPRGGGLVMHSSTASTSSRVIITDDGKLGLGTGTPAERIDIDGAIKIGTTDSNNAGTIRFTGSTFEGRTATEWVPLDPLWRTVSANEIHHNAVGAKVGIGTSQPTAACGGERGPARWQHGRVRHQHLVHGQPDR